MVETRQMVSVVMVVAKRVAKVETAALDVVAVNVMASAMANGQMAKTSKVATIPEAHAAMDGINDPITVRIKKFCQTLRMLLKI